VETGRGEVGAGGFDQAGVDVDRGYAALLADDVGDEGGVVAGAGAHLKDVVARPEVELLEHDGHDGGLGGGAGGLARLVDLGDDGVVLVDQLGGQIGEEVLAAHGAEGGLGGGRGYCLLVDEVVDGGGVGGGGVGRSEEHTWAL